MQEAIGQALVRESNVRKARGLEYLTIGWNSLEAVIAGVAGLLSGSTALVGFSLDSVIEVSSGAALLWRLSLDSDLERRDRIEAVTLKVVGNHVHFVGGLRGPGGSWGLVEP